MLSTSGPRSKQEGADLGLPEQHKISSLEHDDSNNRHDHNMLAYRWRKADICVCVCVRERGCCFLVVSDGSCCWKRSIAGKGRHGEGGRLTLVIRQGGEGGRCRADDERELEASDAG
jgi:hypothetical protein